MHILVSVACASVVAISSPWAVAGLTTIQHGSGLTDGLRFHNLFKGKIGHSEIQSLAALTWRKQQRFFKKLRGRAILIVRGGHAEGSLNDAGLQTLFAMPAPERERTLMRYKGSQWVLIDDDDILMKSGDSDPTGADAVKLDGQPKAAGTDFVDATTAQGDVEQLDGINFQKLLEAQMEVFSSRKANASKWDDHLESLMNDTDRASRFHAPAPQHQRLGDLVAARNDSETLMGYPGAVAAASALKPTSEFRAPDAFPQTPDPHKEWRELFKRTQAEQHNGQMGAFIRRIIKLHGGKWTNEAPIAALAPLYSGRQQNRSYNELLQDLGSASWIETFA